MKTQRFENMAKMEEDHASSLSKSVSGLRNVVVQEILRSIAYDSRKHKGLYEAIVNLSKEVALITEEEYDRIGNVVKEHIETEERMLEEIKKLLDSEEDSRVKHLLLEIEKDEVKHHTLMRNLLDAVINKETLFEQDTWNMLWKGVDGHGAPRID